VTKLETAKSSETSVSYHITTRRHNAGDHDMNTYRTSQYNGDCIYFLLGTSRLQHSARKLVILMFSRYSLVLVQNVWILRYFLITSLRKNCLSSCQPKIALKVVVFSLKMEAKKGPPKRRFLPHHYTATQPREHNLSLHPIENIPRPNNLVIK
jgi:hypothetical protein